MKAKSDCTAKFDYESFYGFELEKKHKDRSYRYFNNINRLAGHFPQAHLEDPTKMVTAWCSNDYVSSILVYLFRVQGCADNPSAWNGKEPTGPQGYA
jgi:hypothetical protein